MNRRLLLPTRTKQSPKEPCLVRAQHGVLGVVVEGQTRTRVCTEARLCAW